MYISLYCIIAQTVPCIISYESGLGQTAESLKVTYRTLEVRSNLGIQSLL